MLPTPSQFRSPEDYLSTLLHELVHATGHRSRLDREVITSSSREFGDPVYAFEELIAETGSAFLCAHLGIFGEVQYQSYMNGWLNVLRNDKKAFFRACRFAWEASEYLLKPLGETRSEAAQLTPATSVAIIPPEGILLREMPSFLNVKEEYKDVFMVQKPSGNHR